MRVACELRTTVAGCDWIIAKWQWLRGALDQRDWWYPSERDLALNLFGKRPDDVFGTDAIASELFDAYIMLGWSLDSDVKTNWDLLGVVKPESMRESEFKDRLSRLIPRVYKDDPKGEKLDTRHEIIYARRELFTLIDSELARIRTQRERCLELEKLDRSAARTIAGCDLTPEGATRLRYEQAYRRIMKASLAELARLKKEAKDDPEVASEIPQTETPHLLDITLITEVDHFIDPRPRPVEMDVVIDHRTRSEPTAGKLTPRNPLKGYRFRDAVFNTPGTKKAPPERIWTAAGIFIGEHLVNTRLLPDPIEVKTSVKWTIFKE
jgi:hypothetical protein